MKTISQDFESSTSSFSLLEARMSFIALFLVAAIEVSHKHYSSDQQTHHEGTLSADGSHLTFLVKFLCDVNCSHFNFAHIYYVDKNEQS